MGQVRDTSVLSAAALEKAAADPDPLVRLGAATALEALGSDEDHGQAESSSSATAGSTSGPA